MRNNFPNKCLKILFDSEEIYVELLKEIYAYTLDKGKNGTSKNAIKNINYHINKNISSMMPIQNKYYAENEVSLDAIVECLKHNGVILLRTFLVTEHYAIITDIDKENVYFFDSYYVEEEFFDTQNEIKNDFNHPFLFNRKVKLSRFSSLNKDDFSLGPIANRECLCIYRNSK